ncbi:topoisomerase II [Flavobacterium macacae]|uniref:Topoisomerase II n=1 Tax=Flavobacterium macacae TaxID=2488993 RepID=A0A3P3W8S7_9FLAO|nr:topoisomerase II [Flavobacterium macacae]RRJ90747.1 topoisomerase II [Flavobacterium macacae]
MKSEKAKESVYFEKIESEITDELNKILPAVLKDYSEIKGYAASLSSLHGTISLNKAENLDMVRGKWMTYEDYIADWLSGLKDSIESGRPNMMQKMFKIESIRGYVLLFLERDFYRHYNIRIKDKPQENLWSIWFGSEILFWGLLIAPRFYDDSWQNKPGRIRKVDFGYWTIGHVLQTGLVDPENNAIFEFRDLDDLLMFYESILKRVSNSIYEKQVFAFYAEYIRKSAEPLTEPFLIPEFRYEGIKQKHKYRLDFTILNCHTGERIGFELSPQSTHMAISGIRTKTQVEMNKDLAVKWGREMEKRNEYFQQYGITTITFTDENLLEMRNCFKAMEYFLSKRKPERKSVDELIKEIILL